MAERTPVRRCAIYVRKSSEEGLDMSYNSLEAQSDACAAYVTSQRHEGWVPLQKIYEDGGYSGGNMLRPGLQQLLADVGENKIDIILVYKIDRLDPVTHGLRPSVETLEQGSGVFCGRHPAVQHLDLNGQAHPQCAAVLCPVRTGGDGRAHPRQGCCIKEEGHMDGRPGAARLCRH